MVDTVKTWWKDCTVQGIDAGYAAGSAGVESHYCAGTEADVVIIMDNRGFGTLYRYEAVSRARHQLCYLTATVTDDWGRGWWWWWWRKMNSRRKRKCSRKSRRMIWWWSVRCQSKNRCRKEESGSEHKNVKYQERTA